MSQFPLPGANWSYLHAPRLQATTGPAGFALQNGTPTVISWTAPNDGQLHRALFFGSMHVTAAETGGQVNFSYTLPDGTANGVTAAAGGAGTGPQNVFFYTVVVQAGSTVSVVQATALTLGAAVLWAEIWGS